MTKVEAARELNAGRRMDALVAYAFYGWRWYVPPGQKLAGFWPPDRGWVRWNFQDASTKLMNWWPDDRFADWDRLASAPSPSFRSFLPYYSTTIKDALEVLEELRSIYGVVRVDLTYESDIWTVAIAGAVVAETSLPLAICRTALLRRFAYKRRGS